MARRRRIRLAFACLFAALAVITAVAIVALYQGREAERQRDTAASRELAASATTFLDADPGLSLALALRALDRRDTVQAETVLRQATLSSRARAAWPAHDDWVFSLEPSADGRRMRRRAATARCASGAWPTAAGSSASTRTPAWALGASLSPDGGRVACTGDDGIVAVWDVATGRKRVLQRHPRDYRPLWSSARTGAGSSSRCSTAPCACSPRTAPAARRSCAATAARSGLPASVTTATTPSARATTGPPASGTSAGPPTVLRHPAVVNGADFSPGWAARRDGGDRRRRPDLGRAEAAGCGRASAPPRGGSHPCSSARTGAASWPPGRTARSASSTQGGPPLEVMSGHRGMVLRLRSFRDRTGSSALARTRCSASGRHPPPSCGGRRRADYARRQRGRERRRGRGARVWDPATGAVKTLRVHERRPTPGFSPDGLRRSASSTARSGSRTRAAGDPTSCSPRHPILAAHWTRRDGASRSPAVARTSPSARRRARPCAGHTRGSAT